MPTIPKLVLPTGSAPGAFFKSFRELPHLYNGQRGLARFYNSRDLGAMLAQAFITGALFIGDSVWAGNGVPGRSHYNSVPQVAIRLMKKLLNPAGVGGEGYLDGGNLHGRFFKEAGWTQSGSTNGAGQPGYMRNNVDTSRFGVTFDPTSNPEPYKLQDITGLEVIFDYAGGTITDNYDVHTGASGSYVAVGAGGVGTGALAWGGGSGGGADATKHTGTKIVTTTPAQLLPGSRYTFQFSRAAGYNWVCGLYAYCKDESTGFHGANLSLAGAKIEDFIASAPAIAASGTFCKTTGMGSSQMRVVVPDFIINNWLNHDVQATMYANALGFIDAVKAYTSAPPTLFVIPFTPRDQSGETATTYYSLVDGIKQACQDRPDDAACLDLPALFGRPNGTYFNNQGWMYDTLHPNQLGSAIMARLIVEALCAS